MTNFQTKQSVKSKKTSAKEAYDRLYPLVGEEYANSLPTMIWLKNLIYGKAHIENKQNRQEKKEAFRKKFKK